MSDCPTFFGMSDCPVRLLFWSWTPALKNHYVPLRVSVPRVPRWDLVEFKGRFYPQEVSAPPKVCIGCGDKQNPPLLQLKLRTPLQFSCRDLRGRMSTAIMQWKIWYWSVRFDMHACQNAYCNTEFGIDNIKPLRESVHLFIVPAITTKRP